MKYLDVLNRSIKMTKDELKTWLISKGYTQDKYGHFQKVSPLQLDVIYRYKIQDISVRFEKQIDVCGKHEWMRISSGYLKKLSINRDNKICGLKR
jgi:hypothetical protein